MVDEKDALTSNLRISIQQLQTKNARNQRKEALFQEKERVIKKLMSEVAKLEHINGDQRFAIGKMKKQLLKTNNMKEAFMMADK